MRASGNTYLPHDIPTPVSKYRHCIKRLLVYVTYRIYSFFGSKAVAKPGITICSVVSIILLSREPRSKLTQAFDHVDLGLVYHCKFTNKEEVSMALAPY